MTINVGDKIPNIALYRIVDGKVAAVHCHSLLADKRSVLFAVPGAFTPTCSEQHLPGFVANNYAFKKKGIDQVICISVNDAYVMRAWQEEQAILDEVTLLADGNGELTEALGLTLDLRGAGMGLRSTRYAMVVDNGIVTHLMVEPTGGGLNVSRAESVLAAIGQEKMANSEMLG